MKKPLFLVALFILSLIPLPAQTFKVLCDFTDPDRKGPHTIIQSGNLLYGTTLHGGRTNDASPQGSGTIFVLRSDGSRLTNLYTFNFQDGSGPGRLTLQDQTLYGTTAGGGTASNGTLFRLESNGTGFKHLHSFSWTTWTNQDGAVPDYLMIFGDSLFGTTLQGGSLGYGTVFRVKRDGTGFTNLHTFSSAEGRPPKNGTMVNLNETLYGVCGSRVFALSTDGTAFTNLHSFEPGGIQGSPVGGLTSSGNRLFGSTKAGGAFGFGSLFRLRLDGEDFHTLYSFTGGLDGMNPVGALVVNADTLYGTACYAGSHYPSVLFAVGLDGTGFTTLQLLTNRMDGVLNESIAVSRDTLFGTTWAESSGSSSGTVFSISLIPQLSILPYETSFILAWPTQPSGFELQSSSNLLPFSWRTVTQSVVVLNGQNIAITPARGTQQFYRLQP